jgi:hypothetical protein
MKIATILSLPLLLAFSPISSAQLVDAPSYLKTAKASSPAYQSLVDARSVSVPFLTTERKIEIFILAGLYSFDGVTTQHARNLEGGHFVELNPLARSLVQTRKGQAIAGLMGMSTTVGAAYVFHRLHRERMTRWFMRANVAAETLNVTALAVTTYGPSRRIW